MAMQPNYTEEQITQLHDLYAEMGNDGLNHIAEQLGKPVRSVRAKLVRDGLYVAPAKASSAKVNGPSKKEILREFADVGIDATGLEGATKEALVRIIQMIRVTN